MIAKSHYCNKITFMHPPPLPPPPPKKKKDLQIWHFCYLSQLDEVFYKSFPFFIFFQVSSSSQSLCKDASGNYLACNTHAWERKFQNENRTLPKQNAWALKSNKNTSHRKIKKSISKLKIIWIKVTTFSNDAFQSYYDLFQVNWLVQT